MDLPGGGDGVGHLSGGSLGRVALILQDAHTQLNALVADIGARPSDEPADLILVLAAEGTAHCALLIVIFCHEFLPHPRNNTNRVGTQAPHSAVQITASR